MTGGHSKADSISDSRGRTEGRSSLPRRRATKMSYSETGGFETDLALAVQESLRYARQAEREAKEREESTITISNHVDDEGGCMSPKFNDVMPGECVTQSCAQLKDLLLVNLDLVQHQQETLVERDKEIRSLKSDNNMVGIGSSLNISLTTAHSYGSHCGRHVDLRHLKLISGSTCIIRLYSVFPENRKPLHPHPPCLNKAN